MTSLQPDRFTGMEGNPIEDGGEPSPCPFCGSGADQLVVERWSAEDDPDTSYHVECLKCGCNGPQAATQVEAAQEWNGRGNAGLHTSRLSSFNTTLRSSKLS